MFNELVERMFAVVGDAWTVQNDHQAVRRSAFYSTSFFLTQQLVNQAM